MVLITTLMIVYGFLDGWQWYQRAKTDAQFVVHPYFYNAYEIFLFSLMSSPFVYFAILSAVLPYADSLTTDRESGYIRYATFHSGYWSFLINKFAANWLVGGAAVVLSMTLAFGIACVLFPMHLPPLYTNGAQVSMVGIPHSPLAEIFETAPTWYILARICLGFFFGSAYATLGFAISSRTTNRYVVLASPLIIFIVATLLIHMIGLYGYIPPVAIIPELNGNSSASTILVNYFVIYGVSLFLIFCTYFQNWIREGQRTA